MRICNLNVSSVKRSRLSDGAVASLKQEYNCCLVFQYLDFDPWLLVKTRKIDLVEEDIRSCLNIYVCI
jgi:hypothetical protein